MKPSIWRDRTGVAAIEFAIIAPVLLSLLFGVLGLSLAFWTRNALQATSEDAARCVAISATPCAAVTVGCDSILPAVCYTEQLAMKRGLPALKASQIIVNPIAVYGGLFFTSITINYSFSMLNYRFTLVGTGMFPNPNPIL